MMMSSSNSKQVTSQVRVGVRVRPLTSQELGQGGKSVLKVIPPEIRLGERRFTYDAVFDEQVDQNELYSQVSTPLLTSFLEGYNATIMAYGQTGSGKTFTMGSEAHTELELSENTGLIPRFMNDLFHNLEKQQSSHGSSLSHFVLQASFLEVYGEDVHDLLDPSRTSLPLREDANGGVICAGLTHRSVATATQALTVLHEGTMNRTTAATLMNLTSSRSHAIFTVYLTQTQSTDGVDVVTTSRFTFVDLAGSERMKKTGAEGERAREGIKINEGLLALGNVINALADEERIATGKTVHVPYRQSKLTRLLQDALGGNSQTLFLACVSPSDTNANETLSTMHYANRARNIKNAPTRNVDGNVMEMQRLQSLTQILQTELVKHKFGGDAEESKIGECDAGLWMRQDVSEYLDLLQAAAIEKHELQGPHHSRNASLTLPAPKSRALSISPTEHRMELYNLNESIRLDGDPNKSIMEHFNPLAEVNPDEDMAILDQLLELQQRDSEFQKAQEADDDELKQVEGEIVQQQSLLLQLRESLKVYHDMKDKYEVLMAEVRHLEVEKTELVEQLDKAHTDPTKGCSKAIKRELEKVEQALARARNESRKHRELYRKAEQEAKKSAVLQRKITELKTGRAKLIKKQQETAARHRDYTEARTREILALKRKDRSNEQRLSKMQKEIQMHKKNLDKRQDYCTKLKDKLDQTESHLMKLLAMRNQELRDRTSVVAMSRRPSSALARKSSFPVPANKVTFAPRSEAIDSINFILDQAVVEKIMILEADQRYEECVTEYSEAMRNMVEAVKALEHARELAKNVDNEIDLDESELIQAVEESELKVELLSEELESLRRQLSETDGNEGKEALAEKLIKDKDAPLLRTVLLDTLEKLIETKILHNRLDKVLQRKASALHGLENEVELLNDKIESLTRTNKLRQVVDSSDVGSVETIHRLASENRSQKMQLQHTQSDLTKLNEMLSEARNDNRLLATKTREAEEKVALVLTASNVSEAIEPSKATLDNIHRIWRQLGRPLEELDEIRFEIENCLDHTCTRLLREAQDLKETTLVEVESLEHEIRRMHTSLGRMEEDSIRGDGPLVVQLDRLRRTHAEIEVVYRETATRREALKQQAMSLVTLLGLAGDTIPVELRSLLAPETEVLDLRDDLIAQYELQVSELRVRKSQMLVTNAEVLKNAYQLVSDMNLAEHQVFPLVLADIKRRCVDLPEWWDEAIAEIIVRAVSNAGGVVRATQSFREHLLVVYASLESLSRSRRILSDKLKELVEKAQRILLETVDGEVDAIEAYASFHDALFRLPPLSKERMNACIAEIDALLTCVDDMTQSEIEALVVVHEALNVASNDRSMFWSKVEVATSTVDAKNVRPFNEVVQDVSVDAEDWVLQMVADGTKNYRQLESRLVKLQMIHSEVERLRSRQDTKSKIITLDSEVRTLSTRISEFEDTKCNKQRLLTKKSGSVNLLKEERFRKQMQQKFASKLEKLALLLQSWREGNKEDFDSNLLSDEVRMLLDNGGDNMVEWVEKRTEFMHLRTTQSTKKRRTDTSQDIDSLSTSKVAMHRLAEPANATVTLDAARKKSVAPSQPAERRPAFPKPASSLSTSRKRKGDELPPSKPARQTRSSRSQSTSRMPLSPAHDSRKSGGELDAAKENNVKPAAANKKRLTLPPFGHVLESASTPRNADKEN